MISIKERCPTCGEFIRVSSISSEKIPARKAYRIAAAGARCACWEGDVLIGKPEDIVRYVVAMIATRDHAGFDPVTVDMQAITDLLYDSRKRPVLALTAEGKRSLVARIKDIKSARHLAFAGDHNEETDWRSAVRRMAEGWRGHRRKPIPPLRRRRSAPQRRTVRSNSGS